MSTPRRHQLRDDHGRFASPGPGDGPPRRERARLPRLGPAGCLRLGAEGLGRGAHAVLAALHGELARRLYRLAVVAVALGAAVVLLYEHGDSQAMLARGVQAASATPAASAASVATGAKPAAGSGAEPAQRPGAATGAEPAGQPGAAGGATQARPGHPEPSAAQATRPPHPDKPAEVAAAWYAGRNHLQARQVQPLQQDKVSNREVRVLVLADRGNGRLDTALVTVRRDPHGRWSVP